MDHGSLTNMLSGTDPEVVPTVGMGCTELMWTDRHAYTIVWVSKTGKTIRVQRDIATRTDKNGMSECQDYEFSPDTNAELVTVRLTTKGWKSKRSLSASSLSWSIWAATPSGRPVQPAR